MQAPSWYEGDVSRETLDKLAAYATLLRKWTTRINLISKASEDGIEDRHIWDSAQIYDHTEGEWLDMGSGGGLPGVVVAILAQGDGCALTMTMVESDQRKATFLRTCVRELSLPCTILASRIEDVPPITSGTISARALAPLDHLLGLCARHLGPNGRCLFMKGARWQEELSAARANWRFSCNATSSKTNTQAAILDIRDIERV